MALCSSNTISVLGDRMKSQHLLRWSLTYAMLGSGVAVALLLVVLLKAAGEHTLGADPGRALLLCLFLLLFAAFGIANALAYRRLESARPRA